APDGGTAVSWAWLNGLRLRYQLVKLLRVEAFFRHVLPLPAGGPIRFVGEAHRDSGYAALLAHLCAASGTALQTVWKAARPSTPQTSHQVNARWRNGAAALLSRVSTWNSHPGLTIAFCGNRSILDPVCQALVGRGCKAAWIYPRFAIKCWQRWWRHPVRQWPCDAPAGGGWNFSDTAAIGNIGMAAWEQPVTDWLKQLAAKESARQGQWLARVDENFANFRPAALVLDEDATPLARCAVAIARRHGVPSLVVQHGVPYGRFGFAPLAADRLLAWGESSRQRFLEFGIPAQRVEIVGSPRHDAEAEPRPARKNKRPRVLFLATNPPSDDRPDAVSFHCTARSHAQMLRQLCLGVQRLGDVELVIKSHPRCRQPELFEQVLAGFPRLRSRIVRRGDLAGWFQRCDCVISCGSSAGIEAAWHGQPVIEMLSPGSADLLTPADWGLWGVARDERSLHRLLESALAGDGSADIVAFRSAKRRGFAERNATLSEVFAQRGCAADAAADAILRAVATADTGLKDDGDTSRLPSWDSLGQPHRGRISRRLP
ncbi:MAG: hypothetical protein AB7O62_17245, partial [Pirellulales bacterium]